MNCSKNDILTEKYELDMYDILSLASGNKNAQKKKTNRLFSRQQNPNTHNSCKIIQFVYLNNNPRKEGGISWFFILLHCCRFEIR